MNRIPLRLGTIGLACLALALTPAVAVAQDEASTQAHPIVGAWESEDPPGTDVFHADGTVVSITADGVVGGVWEPTGPNSADVTVRIPTPDGGVAFLRGGVEVSEDGSSYTATYTVELVGADGASSGQMGPQTGTGSRIVVEPMGSPTAPFPDLEAAPAASASPTP
jgi:hypothetical protein